MSLRKDQIENAIEILEKAKPTSWDLKKRVLYGAWVVSSLGVTAASGYGMHYAIVNYPKSPTTTPASSPIPTPLHNITNKRSISAYRIEWGTGYPNMNPMDGTFGLSATTALCSIISTCFSIGEWHRFEAKRVSLKTCLDQTSRETINEICESANIEVTDDASIYTLIDALKKTINNIESPVQESKNCFALSNCWSRLFSKPLRPDYEPINDDLEAANAPKLDQR